MEQKNKQIQDLRPDRLVRSDLNLEKWNIFTTQKKQGYRELKREVRLQDGGIQTQSVKIGLKGSTEALTTEEAVIFYVILDLWWLQGRPEDGIVRTSVNYLLNRLIQSEKGEVKRGNWSKEWLKEKLSRLRRVGIEFSFYERKDGKAERNVSFTLISESVLYNRDQNESGEQDRLSYIKIHPTVIKNLRDLHVKPIRADVMISLKKEISRILYRFIDLILFSNMSYERDVEDLAQELNFGASRIDNLLKQLRKSCEELEGKDLSSGRLEYCRIEKASSSGGWKLVAKKGKQVLALPLPSTSNEAETIIGDAFDLQRKEEDEILSAFDALPTSDKEPILRRRFEIVKEKYSGYFTSLSERMALIDAIKESQNIGPLTVAL